MIFDFDHFDLDHFDQHQNYHEKHVILFRKNSRTATIMPYLCIVDLREEIYAPTRKNLRAHGGGDFSIEMRQRERLNIKD